MLQRDRISNLPNLEKHSARVDKDFLRDTQKENFWNRIHSFSTKDT